MRWSILYLGMAITSAVAAQDLTQSEIQLGCIQVNIDLVDNELDPWDSWQNWCDLDTEQPEALCYNWIVDGWEESHRFDQALILDRLAAGHRTCPTTPDSAPPIIRGRQGDKG